MTDCRACKLEAELGTEEVPHPIDKRVHECFLRERAQKSPGQVAHDAYFSSREPNRWAIVPEESKAIWEAAATGVLEQARERMRTKLEGGSPEGAVGGWWGHGMRAAIDQLGLKEKDDQNQ